MTTLADRWDDVGGEYLPAGWHDVKVKSFRVFSAHTGTKGVEFQVCDRNQRMSKASFFLTDAAVWRLTGFAKACGLTRKQAAAYDIDNDGAHRMLVGCAVRVDVAAEQKDGKTYHVVDGWCAIGDEVAPSATPPQPKPIQEAPADDIPF